MKRPFLFLSLLAFAVAGGFWYTLSVQSAFENASSPKFEIIIPDSATVDQVIDTLEVRGMQFPTLFSTLAGRMNYTDSNLKDGLYEIDPKWNVVDLIRHLRSGKQKPVDITINSVRTIPDLAGKITGNISLDSLDFLSFISDLHEDEQQLMSFYLPNTYEVFYNVSAEELHERIKEEHERFWAKKNRRERASQVGLSPHEVYCLASIVEQESTLESEKPTIASVYLNRIKRGMKLQADPTVVFSVGDFSIRRVLNKHLAIDSPYNTYKYAGIPPGPICMPSISSIEAVLSPTKTNYIFFCAKPGYQNGHAFASTLRGHNNNARRYQRWLSSQGIR